MFSNISRFDSGLWSGLGNIITLVTDRNRYCPFIRGCKVEGNILMRVDNRKSDCKKHK